MSTRQVYLDALVRDASAMGDAARGADASTPVPCCPEWTASDLMWHIGQVHDFWNHIVVERATSRAGYVVPVRPDDYDAVVEFASRSADTLHETLAGVEPTTPVFNWTGRDQDVSWVLRRMAHETAVHRVDVERVAGRDHRLDAELASDGLDEFLDYFVSADRRRRAAPPLAGSVHLHCTDTDGEWTVTPGDGGEVVVTRDHTKADAALRGAANDLLLVLWHRLPLDDVSVFGDVALADAFVAGPGDE